MPAAVHAVSGANVNAQFDDTFADRLTITKIARLQVAQANANARLGKLVAHRI
jgi:hypothetical protein